MRVLHVIPSLSLLHGGPTRALAMMERALTAEGVEVETATSDDDGPGRRSGHAEASQPVQENGVRRHYFRKRLDFYKVAPGMAGWMARRVTAYDLVHIHALFSFSSVAAAHAARRAGVPYIIRPLGTLAHYGVTQRRPWLKRASMRLLEGPALQGAAAVHFTSVQERDEAAAWQIPMRGVVLPLGVEPAPPVDAGLARRTWATLGQSPYLLFLSRLDPKKNVESLLAGFASLAPAWPELRLVVAGGGAPAYVAQLQAQARRLGLAADRLIWAGPVEGDLKASLLAGARLFVLPSFSENFGIAAAEALMAGVPCVLGQGVAVAAQVQGAGAGLAVAPDAVSVAQAIDSLLRDDHPAIMQAAARGLAMETFSARAMGRGLVQLYQDILTSS